MATAAFTPLVAIPPPRIQSNSPAFPGGKYEIQHLFDQNTKTEYASRSFGTNTVVECDFGTTVEIAAFRHLDRDDPATIIESELAFLDSAGAVVRTLAVKHANTRGGETFLLLTNPVTAQGLRWRVNKITSRTFNAVGGAEMAFYRTESRESQPKRHTIHATTPRYLERDNGKGMQPFRVRITHPYVEPAAAVLQIGSTPSQSLTLTTGDNWVDCKLPAVASNREVDLTLTIEGASVAETRITQSPPRPLTIYILPHSHTDIGYTEIQTAIETKQVDNLIEGMAAAKRTAVYPEGSRFVWNVEVLWAADLYLRRLSEHQRKEFVAAVKNGQVSLNGMYLNELTGLCRPEELIQLFRLATRLSDQTGVPIDAAMISDVPGYTWGTVTAMAQAGIKYFSVAPNYFDRIGTILREWENKPFWWVGPDGRSKVLVWVPYLGYAMSGFFHTAPARFVDALYDNITTNKYPYDIAYVRWSGYGDNAVPDTAIAEFVRDWNANYEFPKLIISGTSEAFQAFEKRYGDKLPKVRGDWTPYWEDGAGSSARETAMNRHSSDRLAQAETLFAMRKAANYSASAFEEAWRHVLLYSEHTWGADVSISRPESQKTREQWDIKQSYALKADQQSRALLEQALSVDAPVDGKVDVYNTLSWNRTELVTLSVELSAAGDRVIDESGKAMASQRLANGELTFVAEDVPPFAAKRYTVAAGSPAAAGSVKVDGAILENGLIRVRVDEQTGGIVELTSNGHNFADLSGGEALNDYLYLPGDDLKDVKRNGPVKIRVGEKGPLVGSLIVESEAPGCRKLTREIRIIAGRDHVEVFNLVDKERLKAQSYHSKEGKESVNFAFPFHVPDGEILMDIPYAVIRPEKDQMPSACKDWFTVGRWVDVANKQRGVTLVTLDAPLMQVGGLTARLLNSQTNPDVWRKKVEKTQKVYSWAMNNHWGTNYRAYQDGPTMFRFILRPHRKSSPAENTRFATGFSQPLLPARAGQARPLGVSLLTVGNQDVIVTGLKPSDDGRGLIARLFNAGKSTSTKINWSPAVHAVYLSDTSEQAAAKAQSRIDIPASGLVTVRAELK